MSLTGWVKNYENSVLTTWHFLVVPWLELCHLVIASVCPCGLLNGWRGFPFPCPPEVLIFLSFQFFNFVFRAVGWKCPLWTLALHAPWVYSSALQLHFSQCSAESYMILSCKQFVSPCVQFFFLCLEARPLRKSHAFSIWRKEKSNGKAKKDTR